MGINFILELILKKLINCFIYVVTISLLTLLFGCKGIDVHYVGHSYPATTYSHNIEFYHNSKEVPSGKYVTIGRAVATAPDSYSSQAIKNKLIDEAQICGADAIQVVDFKRIFVDQQLVPEQSAHDNGPVGSWGDRGRRADGSRIAVDASGQVVPMNSRVYDSYKLKARVLFLRLKSKSQAQEPIVEKLKVPKKTSQTVIKPKVKQ